MAVFCLTVTKSVRAQSLVFSSFSSATGLTLTSSATTSTSDGTVLRLVTATTNDVGVAFSSSQPNVTSGFSTAFEFRLSNRGGITDSTGAAGADGFTFTIQTTGATATGATGIGLGYQGINHSLGVEFDTFLNSGTDPTATNGGSNHLGVDSNGSITSLTTVGVSPDFDNGNKWTAWIDYNGSTLEVRVSTTSTRPSSPNLSYSLSSASFQSILGTTTGYVGFTAGTGSAYANHDIISWTFSDSYVSGGVVAGQAIPEPSTYAALAGVLALAAFGMKRFKRAR